MPLKFPLDHYDEAGRLKPPLMFYCFLLFLCRGFLLLVISLSFREDSSRMMSLFFPNKWDFYWSLLPTLPALITLALIAQRTAIWKHQRQRFFRFIPVIFAIALICDIVMQLSILSRIEFRFSFTHGISILISVVGLVYVAKSRHMRDLPVDWSRPD